MAERKAQLPPVPYFHGVFTLLVRITDLPGQFRCDPLPLGVAQYRANQGRPPFFSLESKS
jgi:hypothetical protein